MRVALCGKNAAAVRALEVLLAHGDEVLVVANPGDDGRDGWQPSLAGAAARHGVRVTQPAKINEPEAIAELQSFAPDRLVSIQYEQILRRSFFDALDCPCLNLHFALLPRHRGVAPIAWALLLGDEEAGVTLHHMVVAIDGGDVIDQRAVKIGSEDTAREVYDAISDATAQLFEESHPFPDALLASPRRQDEREACYHKNGDFDFSVRRTDWTRPALELQRWLRAMIFPPMQRPEIAVNGRVLEVARVAGEIGPAPSAAPGTVLACSAAGVEVAAGDGTLLLRELVDPADPAREREAPLAALPPGTRLD